MDSDFEVGFELPLPKEESHYFKSVRRGQGEVCLFNQKGQVAYGRIEKNNFFIERIEINSAPIYDLKIGIGLPDAATIPLLIRSLSEMGASELIFFQADRSQAAKSRMNSVSRFERIAIEAARQSGRGVPLQIHFENKFPVEIFSSFTTFFMDENENARNLADYSTQSREKFSQLGILIGPEGGWSEAERRKANESKFKCLHFPTPVLKVYTAAVCASFFAIERMNAMKPSANESVSKKFQEK